MSATPVRKAIILRGPPGVGKSAVRHELEYYLGKSARHVDLDAHWGRGQWRYAHPEFRYADLQLAAEPVLLVEFAWGEPSGLTFPGATRGAEEWVGLLRRAGRQIFPFYLIAEWKDILQRLIERHGRDDPHRLLEELGRGSFYEHHHHLFTYPEIPGFTEQTIDTTGRTAESVADEIKVVAGL